MNPHYKPFNIDHAKAGAPIATRRGDPVQIYKWDMTNEKFLIAGIRNGGTIAEVAQMWDKDGVSNPGYQGHADLVMTPLCYAEGKPVFVGDFLIDPYGWKTEITPNHIPLLFLLEKFTWPKEEKEEYKPAGYLIFCNRGFYTYIKGGSPREVEEELIQTAIVRSDLTPFTCQAIYTKL